MTQGISSPSFVLICVKTYGLGCRAYANLDIILFPLVIFGCIEIGGVWEDSGISIIKMLADNLPVGVIC